MVSFAIALAFCLEPLVANLPLAAADDVTTALAVLEPLGEEINGITKAPGNIDEMTPRSANSARKRTFSDVSATDGQAQPAIADVAFSFSKTTPLDTNLMNTAWYGDRHL